MAEMCGSDVYAAAVNGLYVWRRRVAWMCGGDVWLGYVVGILCGRGCTA